jgi:protein SCO1/2
MAGAAMNDRRPFVALFAALALAACGQPAATDQEEAPLAGASIGGPFSLTDQNGATVTDAQFAGKYRLMYFGYTYCPDVCPVDLQKLMAGYRVLEQRDAALAARIQPIFISIDPERDTPAVMKSYAAAFHPKLIGLTGTPDQIADVARRFAIVYGKAEGGGTTDYLMNHSNQAYLFGPDGKPLALIAQNGTPDQIADELDRWAS